MSLLGPKLSDMISFLAYFLLFLAIFFLGYKVGNRRRSGLRYRPRGNYVFIDSQNLNLGIQSLGWNLDLRKFRVYLREKYNTSKAFLFIGYMHKNQMLYYSLQDAGYTLIFKPILRYKDRSVKGNVDAELVLQTMIEYENYDKAIIVSSDGDFRCIVDYLYNKDKLEIVLSPHIKTCSVLLRRAAKEKLFFMDNLRDKLEHKK